MAEELPHVRCISCGTVLGHKWERYQDLLSRGIKIETALSMLGLKKYCCRYRMMNPIKVPIKAKSEMDPRDTGLERQMETLTIATGNPAPTIAPLQAMTQAMIQSTTQGMTQATPRYTIVPLSTHSGIELPAIPEVTLPGIPGPGVEVLPDQGGNIIKSYQAW